MKNIIIALLVAIGLAGAIYILLPYFNSLEFGGIKTTASNGSNVNQQSVNAKKVAGGVASGEGIAASGGAIVKQLKVKAEHIDSIDQSTNTDNSDNRNNQSAFEQTGDSISTEGVDQEFVSAIKRDIEQQIIQIRGITETTKKDTFSRITTIDSDFRQSSEKTLAKLNSANTNFTKLISQLDQRESRETASLKQSVSNAQNQLQQAIQSQQSILSQSDEIIKNQIQAEKSAREVSDKELVSANDNEALTRANSDTMINAELARTKSDLLTSITDRNSLISSVNTTLETETSQRLADIESAKARITALTESTTQAQLTIAEFASAERSKIIESSKQLQLENVNRFESQAQALQDSKQSLQDQITSGFSQLAATNQRIDNLELRVTENEKDIDVVEAFPHASIDPCTSYDGFDWIGNNDSRWSGVDTNFMRVIDISNPNAVRGLGSVQEDATAVNGLFLRDAGEHNHRIFYTDGGDGGFNGFRALALDAIGHQFNSLAATNPDTENSGVHNHPMSSTDDETYPRNFSITLCSKSLQ